MTTRIGTPITIYDIVCVHSELGRIKKPTPREKAAFKKLSDHLCLYAEGFVLMEYRPADSEIK